MFTVKQPSVMQWWSIFPNHTLHIQIPSVGRLMSTQPSPRCTSYMSRFRKKNCIQFFQPGQTQNLAVQPQKNCYRPFKVFVCSYKKGADQLSWYHKGGSVCFALHIGEKASFSHDAGTYNIYFLRVADMYLLRMKKGAQKRKTRLLLSEKPNLYSILDYLIVNIFQNEW